MRSARPTLAAALTLLALVLLAGCGGNQIEADQVQASPPTLTIPKDDTAPAEDTPDADETATPTPTPTVDPAVAAAPTQAPATAPGTGGAGATTGEAPADTGNANPGGAQAEENFDTFCQENPGACP
jgi:hypothetical protein